MRCTCVKLFSSYPYNYAPSGSMCAYICLIKFEMLLMMISPSVWRGHTSPPPRSAPIYCFVRCQLESGVQISVLRKEFWLSCYFNWFSTTFSDEKMRLYKRKRLKPFSLLVQRIFCRKYQYLRTYLHIILGLLLPVLSFVLLSFRTIQALKTSFMLVKCIGIVTLRYQ